MARASIRLRQEHIDLLKRKRIFTKWVGDPASYTQGTDNGSLQAGKEIQFFNSIKLESYSGYFDLNYPILAGQRKSHGLCSLGSFSYSSTGFPEEVSIGRYCSIAAHCLVLNSYHPTNRVTTSPISWNARALMVRARLMDLGDASYKPEAYSITPKPYPIIGHDVWIGENVTLALGIRIGTGAVIAANATVTKNVPPYSIVAGNPAEVKRLRFDEETVTRLLASKWWEYDFADLRSLNWNNPLEFLARFGDLVGNGSITPYQPDAITLPDDWIAMS